MSPEGCPAYDTMLQVSLQIRRANDVFLPRIWELLAAMPCCPADMPETIAPGTDEGARSGCLHDCPMSWAIN